MLLLEWLQTLDQMGQIPDWLESGLWGFLAGGALIMGALAGYFLSLSQKVITTVMAFGSGVLISALSFELVEPAIQNGGLLPTVFGFAGGVMVYSLANWYLGKKGAKHRKRSGSQQSSEEEQSGSGLAIAVGALMDGIPESIAIGISMLASSKVSFAAVIAFFISNLPEGLSSSAGMKKAGRSKRFIFGIWIGIALLSGLAAIGGFAVFGNFSPKAQASTTGLAAGAILAMLVDTMIPEAFEGTKNFAGLFTGIGFVAALILSMMEG